MIKSVLIFVLLVYSETQTFLFAQRNRAVIAFSEEEHNFGTFKESDGIVTQVFTFFNNGNLPLIINEVTSSNGCSASGWTSDPVIPGDSGRIQVHFNPKDLPGAFIRTVVVKSNAENPVVKLVVRGVVIPVDLVGEVYKYSLGDLRLESNYVTFGEVYKGDTIRSTIKIYNASEVDNLHVSFPDIPEHIRIITIPEILAPLEEGVIKMEYFSDAINDWAFVVDRLNITVNGEKKYGHTLNVTANIRENFTTLTSKDLLQAPLVEFDNSVFNFGIINQKQSVNHDFILSNRGKKDLYIRKIIASCGCTAVQPEKMIVPPGDSIRITAVFDGKSQAGKQKKAITIISNDPKHYRTVLWIEGIVELAKDQED